MKAIRLADQNWRPDEVTLVHTGDYRVPEDMSADLAERAVAEGVAVLIDEAPPTPKQAERARKAAAPKASPATGAAEGASPPSGEAEKLQQD